MTAFTYHQPEIRVVFGAGTLDRIADEVRRLGATRAVVLATPGRQTLAEDVAHRLATLSVGVYAAAEMHVPIESARAARDEVSRRGGDCCVAVGGGSATGLAKAIALTTGLPIVAIPTTYAGSEMTPRYGLTEAGIKKTGRDPKVLPKTVIYDPLLTLSLLPHVSGPSGMNAMAHLVEGLYAEDANPVISLLALEGIRVLVRALPAVVREPRNIAARTDAMYGAWLGGSVLGAVGMGVHHKLCHTLGGSFNLPHADVHTVILPHAVAYNRAAAPDALRAAAGALGADDAAQGLYDLAVRIGAPTALKDIGMPFDGLDRAARLATEHPYYNPRPIEYGPIRELLENAYYGRRPV